MQFDRMARQHNQGHIRVIWSNSFATNNWLKVWLALEHHVRLAPIQRVLSNSEPIIVKDTYTLFA